MSERIGVGAAGKCLGVSGGAIRRAGHTTVTIDRLEASAHTPMDCLRWAQVRERRSVRMASGSPSTRPMEVSCCACGAAREARPILAERYAHLVCGPWCRSGKRPAVPDRPGMIRVHTLNVAGYFDGDVHRIAAVDVRASVDRATALARSASPNAREGRVPDG